MVAPILNASDLQYLGEVRLKAPADAPHLVRFFTDLADWADNELFLYMGKHGAKVQELSVLARSSYDSKLGKRVNDERNNLVKLGYQDLVVRVYEEVDAALDRVRTENPLKVKSDVERLVNELLGAAQTIGSGKT